MIAVKYWVIQQSAIDRLVYVERPDFDPGARSVSSYPSGLGMVTVYR